MVESFNPKLWSLSWSGTPNHPSHSTILVLKHIKTHGDLGYPQSRTPPYLRIPSPTSSQLQLVQPFLPLPPINSIHPQKKWAPKLFTYSTHFDHGLKDKSHPGNAGDPGLNSGPGTRIVSEHSYESHVPCEARWYSSEFYHDFQFAKCLFARE